MVQYVGMPQYQKILRLTKFVGCRAKIRQTTRHFYHLWPFLGCYSYHTEIVKILRLLCMMNKYVGMHQFQKILRWTQCVGCRAKTRKQQEKRHFGHLWQFWGYWSYHTLIVKISRLLCMMHQYVGILQYQKILRQTQFVGRITKYRQKTRKKVILVIYGHFGSVVATIW